MLSDILLLGEKDVMIILHRYALTLKLLGAPIFYADTVTLN